MDEKQYISERVDDQIQWYDNKSVWNQKQYKRLRVAEITFAACIPFLAGYFADDLQWIKILTGFFGVMIAVIAGLVSLYSFQEHWIEYRTTSESLKHEKYLYLTKAPPYNSEQAFSLFVERIESLISTENSKWPQRINSSKKINKTKENK